MSLILERNPIQPKFSLFHLNLCLCSFKFLVLFECAPNYLVLAEAVTDPIKKKKKKSKKLDEEQDVTAAVIEPCTKAIPTIDCSNWPLLLKVLVIVSENEP